jgi:hypothetical protein
MHNADAHSYYSGWPVFPLSGLWWGAWPGWPPWWRRAAQCQCSLPHMALICNKKKELSGNCI